MYALVSLAALLLLILQLVLLARLVLDWAVVLAPTTGTQLQPARGWAHEVTEPVLAPVRRHLPALRLGSTSFDLAFTVVLLGVVVARSALLSL